MLHALGLRSRHVGPSTVRQRSPSLGLVGRLSRSLILGIGFGTIAAIGIGLSVINGPLSRRKLGTWGDWLVGSATVAAVIVALQASRDANVSAENLRYLDESGRRTAQARCVIPDTLRVGVRGKSQTGNDVYAIQGFIGNYGDYPIRPILMIGTIPGQVEQTGFQLGVPVIAPGDRRVFDANPAVPLTALPNPNQVAALISFEDVHGDRWEISVSAPGDVDVQRTSNRSGFWRDGESAYTTARDYIGSPPRTP